MTARQVPSPLPRRVPSCAVGAPPAQVASRLCHAVPTVRRDQPHLLNLQIPRQDWPPLHGHCRISRFVTPCAPQTCTSNSRPSSQLSERQNLISRSMSYDSGYRLRNQVGIGSPNKLTSLFPTYNLAQHKSMAILAASPVELTSHNLLVAIPKPKNNCAPSILCTLLFAGG